MQGKIIEYVEHGKFICALVMEDLGARLRLLNQNGREVKLPRARVVHASKAPVAASTSHDLIIQTLQEVSCQRQSIQLPVSLKEVWELASETPEQEFSARFLAELCFGDNTDDQTAAFIRAVFNDRIYFKYKGETIQAHAPEVVEQLLIKQENEQQRQELLNHGAAALKQIMEGQDPGDWPENDCFNILRDYYLFDKEAEHWELARELLKKAELNKPHDIYQLLVKKGLWQENENIPLLRYQIPVEFSEEALAQAEEISSAVLSAADPSRKDLRHLPAMTVDGAYTRDFDDALHIERKDDNYEVGIHITDVACFIPPGSPLFKEAETRTTSIYFPDATIPMLPRELSEQALSLIKGEDRAALSFLVTLSAEGEILSSRIVRSLINVKQQLSYEDALIHLKNDPDLKALSDLSENLKKRRINAGALIIPIPDVVFSFDQGTVSGIRLVNVDSPMRSMISEYMVLANTLAASFLSNRQEPGLYRTQEPARKRFFSQPDEQDLYINFRQRRFLSRGNLLTTPKRHDGVGVEQYTTVTSPIRRLLDLVIQHQIGSILAGQGARFTTMELNEFASIIGSSQSRLNLVRQLRHRYWLFKYLEKRVGQYFPAFTLDKRNRKIQVVLTDFLFEGELPFSQAVRPELGDQVQVRIAHVSALDNTIRLEW